MWGSGDAVQSRVVNQNESRDLGNTNTNIVLPNTTALTSLIKTQESPPTPQQQREGLKMCVSCDAYEHVRSESNYVCIFCFVISANYWCNSDQITQMNCVLECVGMPVSRCMLSTGVDLRLPLIVSADMIHSIIQAGLQWLYSQRHKERQLPIERGCCFPVRLLAGTRHLHHTLTIAGIV